jgi:hypothetical protein
MFAEFVFDIHWVIGGWNDAISAYYNDVWYSTDGVCIRRSKIDPPSRFKFDPLYPLERYLVL